MTSQQIDYVLTLADEGNFSKAADKLFVTQPALSQFIKNTETQVGMLLFDRSTSPIQLTPAGEIFVEIAKKIRMNEQELERRIADLSHLTSGHFTLGTSSFRASCLLPKSIREFSMRYPGIKVDILTDHVSNLKKMLLNGEIDFCIEADDFDDTLFHSEELFLENYYMAVPTEHPVNECWKENRLTFTDILTETGRLYTVKPVSLTDCNELPFVLMKKGSCFYNTFHDICEKANLLPKIHMEVNQIETAFHWTNEGIALSFIPDTLIRFGNYSKHPLYYKIETSKASKNIVIAVKKNRYISHAMKEYIHVLRELIGYGTWSI